MSFYYVQLDNCFNILNWDKLAQNSFRRTVSVILMPDSQRYPGYHCRIHSGILDTIAGFSAVSWIPLPDSQRYPGYHCRIHSGIQDTIAGFTAVSWSQRYPGYHCRIHDGNLDTIAGSMYKTYLIGNRCESGFAIFA